MRCSIDPGINNRIREYILIHSCKNRIKKTSRIKSSFCKYFLEGNNICLIYFSNTSWKSAKILTTWLVISLFSSFLAFFFFNPFINNTNKWFNQCFSQFCRKIKIRNRNSLNNSYSAFDIITGTQYTKNNTSYIKQ